MPCCGWPESSARRPRRTVAASTVAPTATESVTQDLARCVPPRQPGDAATRVGAGTAQVQAGHGATIVGLAEQRTRAEQLVEAQRAMKDVAAQQAVLALEIQRREEAASENAGGEVRRMTVHRGDRQVGEGFPVAVPAAVGRGIDVLAEQAGDMLSRRRQAVVQRR